MKSKNALKTYDIIDNNGFVLEHEGQKVKYFLEPHVSVERYRAMQKIELEMSFAVNFKNLYGNLQSVYELLNNTRFADSAVMIRDILEGVHKIDDNNNIPAILKYAALILNTENEDRTKYDEAEIDKKIKIWTEAGVPVGCFFAVVLHSVNGLMENYKEITLSTLKRETETQKK